MTSRDTRLRPLLRRHYAALRGALALRHALRAAGAAAVVVTLALALGAAFPAGEGAAWARALGTAVLALAAVAAAVAGFLRARPRFDAWLERVEGRFPEVRSWLRNALDFEDRPPAYTSPELARALGEETARRLARVPLQTLRPALGARAPLLATGLSLAAVALLAVTLPARTERSWRTLLDPRAAAPPVRLEVEPGSVTVTPGAALAVRAHVWGTGARPRLLRDAGPALEGVREGEGGTGERLWRFDLVQLTRPLDYRVRVARAESPRYRVSLAGAPQPVSFEIEIRPPAYARLPVQRGAATRGDLSALRGSVARVEVLFDRDLASLEARVAGEPPRAWTAVSPRRWRGEVRVRGAGEYELAARAEASAEGPGGTGRFRYRIQPLADAPPVLTVRTPEGDVDLPAGQQVPYEVLGQDDLGLTELRLQYRRDPEAPWTDVPVARFPGEPREAHVAQRWDASTLALLPGQSASFRFQLFDGNAVDGRGVATSPTYELRFPSLAEMYQKVDQSQGTVQEALEKAAERAKELQKSLDRLGRQAPTPATGSPQSYERREEVKSAVERQQELARQIDQATNDLRQSLAEAAERRAFDETLTRRLREMAEVMDQIQSKEFREALQKLQQALDNLERRPQDPGLQDWRQRNEQLLKNLERTIELLKRLRQEEKLQALAQRAGELEARQEELNQRQEQPDRQAAKEADEQKRAADESEQLAKDARALAEELSAEPKAKPALDQAAQELEQEAAPAQREASESMSRSQRQQAQQSGQRASRSLQRAHDQLSSLASTMQQAREGVDLAAVRRAAQDLVSLQRAAEASLTPGAAPSETGDRQTDLSEGTSRVADSLWALSQKSPFISQQLGEALGRAIMGLQQSGRRFGQGDRAGGESAGRLAAGALVEAVLQLRQAESSMCQSPGGGQSGGSLPMRMERLGQSQSQLNEQTHNLAQRLSEAVRLSAGDRDELRRLADEQARLHEQVDQIQKDEALRRQLLGRLDQTAEDMKQVEEALRQGQLGDDLEQRQQHILSRLLDAQRSVNRQDFDPRRESRPGQDVARSSPPGLPADLMRESDRLRLDLLKAQADRYPAQYRAFIEAYLRALGSGDRR